MPPVSGTSLSSLPPSWAQSFLRNIEHQKVDRGLIARAEVVVDFDLGRSRRSVVHAGRTEYAFTCQLMIHDDRGIVRALGVWAFLVVYSMIALGIVPRTFIGWALILLGGPPLALGGEFAAEALYHWLEAIPPGRAVAAWLQRRTGGRTISPLRISVFLAGFLTLITLAGGLLWVILSLVRRWPVADQALAEVSRFLGA